MAVTSIHPIRSTVGSAVRYIIDPDKTVNGLYVSSYLCRTNSRGAAEDFTHIRKNGTGRTEVLAQHIIQSFKPGEITPEKAFEIGEELCDRFLKGEYQYMLAVHTDHEHIHCHIILNNINLCTNRSFETEENQGKKSERAWAKLRNISDEICREYGLSVIEEPQKSTGISHFERDMQKEGKSWKDKLRVKIAEIAYYSKSLEDFFKNCTESGIEYVYKPKNKYKLKFRMQGQERFTRAETLGEEYTAERIAEQIEQIQKLHHNIAEISKSETSEIPEVKPTEKKEDKWADIHGMQNANIMIAELESAGIDSLNVFKSFMWNIRHDDDHTDELASLKKEIKAVDSLIAKIKHLDEIAPVYKEYKSLKGFRQSRFRKKNADVIEDYEKTVDYIKEYRKPFYADGKPPTIFDLIDKSNALKSQYNALLSEHEAFVVKRDTASKYTRQVKKYLDEQYMKRERERSQQRTFSQQKKKNILE
ncbi:MAG: relaxase/mobilization nuclease domain-containing protein [Ruminococcus sp.]|nr:relaxase/mobilization nuclease domain-containing protein [Ruminococcus sp.]